MKVGKENAPTYAPPNPIPKLKARNQENPKSKSQISLRRKTKIKASDLNPNHYPRAIIHIKTPYSIKTRKYKSKTRAKVQNLEGAKSQQNGRPLYTSIRVLHLWFRQRPDLETTYPLEIWSWWRRLVRFGCRIFLSLSCLGLFFTGWGWSAFFSLWRCWWGLVDSSRPWLWVPCFPVACEFLDWCDKYDGGFPLVVLDSTNYKRYKPRSVFEPCTEIILERFHNLDYKVRALSCRMVCNYHITPFPPILTLLILKSIWLFWLDWNMTNGIMKFKEAVVSSSPSNDQIEGEGFEGEGKGGGVRAPSSTAM